MFVVSAVGFCRWSSYSHRSWSADFWPWWNVSF